MYQLEIKINFFHRTGELVMILPNSPLIYYPDTVHMLGVMVYFLSKILQLLGHTTVTPRNQALALAGVVFVLLLIFHLALRYFGL